MPPSGAAATAREIEDGDRRQLHFHGALSGLVRDDELHGRPHVVAPVVMLREMVLEQDNGTGELIPAAELDRSAEMDLWEGRPVTVGHPEVNGRFVSAGIIEAAETSQIGTIRNVATDERNGYTRLVAEAWIDRELAERTDEGEEILDRLDEFREAKNLSTATPLEVSTGYWSKFRAEGGALDGVDYRGVQESIIPDHLALLPNGIGRCSLDDGCGLPRLNRNGEPIARARMEIDGNERELNILSSARTPSFETAVEGEVPDDWPPSLEAHVEARGWEDVSEWSDLTADQQGEIARTSLLGEPEETYAASLVFPVVDPEGALRENALVAVLSGRGAAADVPESALETARGVARSLLEEEFGRELDENADDDEADGPTLTLDLSGIVDSVRETLRERLGEIVDRTLGRNQGLSLDDVREAVADAVEERHGRDGVFTWIEELFEDEVVYSIDPSGGAEELWRAAYEIDEETGEALIDFASRQRVEKQTEFVPVQDEAAEEGRRLELKTRYEALLEIKGNTMTREELIQRLSDCDSCPFRAETLQAMDDDELVAAANASEVEFEGNLEGGSSGDEGGAEASGSDEAGAGEGGEPETNESGEGDGDDRVTLSRDEYEAFRALVSEREESREETIQSLVENEDCVLPESDLRALSDEALAGYAASLEEGRGEGDGGRRNYAARGGRRTHDVPSGDEDDYFSEHPRTPSVVMNGVGSRRGRGKASSGGDED